MSVHYTAVQWTRAKWVYDVVAAATGMGFVFAYRHFAAGHGWSTQVIALRSFGTCAFAMLSFILCIGPLARLDRRFLPWLYNRRHLGVMMAVVGLLHAREVLAFHLAYGRPSPLAALFVYDTTASSSGTPVAALGALGLAIVVVMAVTSHDFWQRFLGPTAWKWLHMSVYVAYVSLSAHVLFGAVVSETATVPVAIAVAGMASVLGLHLAAARRGAALDHASPVVREDGVAWLDAGPLEALPLDRAVGVCPAEGERIAVVRHAGGVSAVHGVCAHQGGPLTEARVIDGCLTCPWHGWQYRPGDGRSPPPFGEKLPTYRVRLKNGRVLVDPRALEAGTAIEPARDEGARERSDAQREVAS